MSKHTEREMCYKCRGDGHIEETKVFGSCPKCDGNGWVSSFLGGENVCSKCDGRGKLTQISHCSCPECSGHGYHIRVVDDNSSDDTSEYSGPYS